MKKTLIALMALAGVACADSPLTLVDQWTFDGNLKSVNGKTFTAQAISVSYSNGVATLDTGNAGNAGIHLNDDNKLNCGNKDWALQVTMQVPGIGGIENGDALLNTSNNDNGFKLVTAKDNETITIKGSNGDATTLPYDSTSMVTYTLLNYNGNLYVGADQDWYCFVNSNQVEVDFVNGAWNPNRNLNKLMIGFGDGASNATQGTYKLDNISVYTFDSSKVSVADVKAALIPEPATATLSLLALAGLCARRRRA